MAIKTVVVRIKGKSSLLMHQFPLEKIDAIEKKTPKEQAEIAAYRDPDTEMLYIPSACIQRCFVNGGLYSKGKGRASLQKIVAASLMVSPERISLNVKEYKVDSRAVVVPATKGRVIRHRPRLDEWECEFEVDYEDTLMTEEQVRKVVDDSGERVGLLDFRPEKKGSFGRFAVVFWQWKKVR